MTKTHGMAYAAPLLKTCIGLPPPTAPLPPRRALMRRSWGQDVRVSAVVISFLAEHPDNATRGRQMRPADLPWRGIPPLYTYLLVLRVVSGCGGK